MNATETFQHYQVLKREDGALWELGRGAMGVTYKAFDVNLRSLVALKVINAHYLDHPVARQRFVREARAAAALRHRNIAHVYHLGMDAECFFYAMEFIDGETLDAIVRAQGPLPPQTVLEFALQTSRALSAAARQRLVHRDIKPTNLMIVDEEDDDELQQTVKVIDFGLARSAVREDSSVHLTMGGFVGTPQYASPEQLEEKTVDGRSDIYSLGATLWFLLAGRPPFTGTLTSLITQHLSKEPPWDQLASTPAPVRELLRRMLRKKPEDRPQSAGELRREIENCLNQLTTHGVAAGRGAKADGFLLDGTDSSVPGINEFTPTPQKGKPEAFVPGVGTLLGGRYQIMRLVGEGSTGRVFQAHDLRGEGRTVALKVLHPDLMLGQEEFERFQASAAKVQNAPHPGLLSLDALEGHRGSAWLVMEWSGGLTLVDLLRSRGRLTVVEALSLLKQAAAATDFARANGLECLELYLHQVFVIPTDNSLGDPGLWSGDEGGELLAKSPLSVNLKIDPLGPVKDAGEVATWGGDVTLISARQFPHRDRLSSVDGLIESDYLYCLGRLFYELVEGAPPPSSHLDGNLGAQAFALPGLGEAGGALLRRALSPNPGFHSDTEFFELLARSAGFEPEQLRASAPPEIVPAPPRQHPFGEGASTADAPLTKEHESAMLVAVEVVSEPHLEMVPTSPELGHPAPQGRDTLWWLIGGMLAGMLLAVAVLVPLRTRSRSEPAPGPAAPPPPSRSGTSGAEHPLPPGAAVPAQAAAPTPAATPASTPSEPLLADEGSTPLTQEIMNNTMLGKAVAPATVIPYAPGVEPDDDAAENEIRVPFAPGFSGDEDNLADAAEAETPANHQTPPATGAPKPVSRRSSSGSSGRSHSHHRSAPQPNFWQRLFGIKPKPTHGR